MTTHLDALKRRLSNERARLDASRSAGERQLREVWVTQIQKEIADALLFIGQATDSVEIDDDELLAALMA